MVEQGSTEKTEKVYADVMKGISIKDQSAMEKFMTKAHNFHRPAILVAKLIDRLIPTSHSRRCLIYRALIYRALMMMRRMRSVTHRKWVGPVGAWNVL